MEIVKRPRGRPRKVVAEPVAAPAADAAPGVVSREVPPLERKARRWRPPVQMPDFVPQFGRRYREPKRKPVLHPFTG